MSTPRKLRAGIVGAGYIAGAHALAYTNCPGVRVVAVADPVAAKAARLAGRIGAQPLATVAEVLALGVDMVSICTPSPTHRAVVELALDAGVHVLCEKPLARTVADAEWLVAAAAMSSQIVMIGHVSRFEPDHRRARQLVAGGRLGELRMMSQSITASMPSWSEGGWLADPDQSGGPLVDLAIHSFDYLAWINASPPVRVHAVGADTSAGPATYVLVTLRYANGAIGMVETSWAHPASHGFKVETELTGSGGRLSWNYDGVIGGVLNTVDGATVRFDPLGNRGFDAEIAAFVEATRTGGPSPVPAAEALAALRTSLAAAESLRTGRTVDIAVQASA